MSNLYVLSSDNYNGLNGAAKFVKIFEEEREEFEKRGLRVSVIANNNSYQDERIYVETRKYKIKKRIKAILYKSAKGQLLKLRYVWKHNGRKAVDCFKRINPKETDTAVLLNDMGVALEFFAEFGTRYKTIFMEHNSGDLLSMLGSKILEHKKYRDQLSKEEIEILDKSDSIVCVASNAVNVVQSKGEEYIDKTVHISIGQKSYKEDIKRDYSKLKLVTVGSVCDRKNQLGIIKAIKALGRDDISLICVGDGDALNQCTSYVMDNDLSKYVSLKGAQNDVKQFLDDANCFILASQDEGLPIAAQEAMNDGLALVLTDVGGCAELIDGNGMLIRRNDQSQLVNAIKAMTNNTNLLEEMGKRSKEIFEEKYSLEKMINCYIYLVDSLLSVVR